MAIKGFRYLFGIHMGICRGADELVQIKAGDRSIWRGSVSENSTIEIDAYNVFGGEEGEGGIRGPLQLMFGAPTQGRNASIEAMVGGRRPAFRGLFTAFFDGIVCMVNPYPKPWSFRVRRLTANWDGPVWYPEKVEISLVRPTSVGEVGPPGAGAGGGGGTSGGGSGETVPNSPGYRQGNPIRYEGPESPRTLPLTTNGPVTAIERCLILYDFRGNQIDAGPEQYTINYAPIDGGELVASIAFNDLVSDGAGGTVPGLIEGAVQVRVTFRYTLTTINPLGPGDIGDPEAPGPDPGDALGTAVIRAMNPAHIIYECLTNRLWGRGFERTRLDDAAFRKAADQLFVEGFGLCLAWKRQDTIQAFVQSVLDHIGGVLYTDRTTALLTIRLIRNDYFVDELPLFTKGTGLLEITEAEIPANATTNNEVRVKYRDPVTNEERVVRQTNAASLQASGGASNQVTLEFPGIPTAELAMKVARRESRSRGPGLRRFKITLDRRGFTLVPGSVIRIQDLPRSIPDMVLRVVQIDLGSLNNGRISVVAIQDVFGLPNKDFVVIGPPSWVPPNNNACVAQFTAFELPYHTLYRRLSPSEFAFLNDDSAYLGVSIAEGQPLNASCDIAVKPGAVTPDDQPTDSSGYCGYEP